MIVNKLIPIDRPFGANHCHTPLSLGAGAAIAAGVSGLSSIFGGILGKNSQSSANKTNLQINRENQAWNEKMMDKQNSWNLAQWNRENDYNSAAQQVARYRAAGLNPYLMMQNGSAGSASSVTSAAPGNAGMSNTVSPFDYSAAAAGVGNAVAQYYNNQLMSANVRKAVAEAIGQEKQNTWLDTKLQAEIESIKQNTSSSKTRQELDKFSLFHAKTMLPGELATQSLQNSSLAENIANQRANTLYTEMQTSLAAANLAWLPKEKEAEIAQYMANTFAAIESGKLSQKQGELAMQNKLESAARTEGIHINNKTMRAQAKYIVSKASWDASKSKWDSIHSQNNSGPDSSYKWIQKYPASNFFYNMLQTTPGLSKLIF